MILLILLILFQSTNVPVYAADTNTYYARVLFEQVYLYKTPIEDNSLSNIHFELPKTYFVELIGKENNFYKAKYLDFYGYVKKDSVQAVANAPINPFLTNINFRVYASLSETMWSTASTQNNSSIITQIPHLTNNLTFIGKINGECLIENRTNIWYFCKYTLDKEYYGYVYSDFCDEMTTISNNIEELEYISNPTFEVVVPPTKTIPQNSNAVGIVIGILSIPVLIFVFMIMKGTRILNSERTHKKEVVDY